ncbi:prolyl 4-hydroxylase subunit alpha-3-like [Macrosteles quadrilineatus]|uniref:prolyl 4-hydroxylase subunit alpha-3-like n=1 Tax=Macrosteles quadrilineatus TaxID=74068 RepID=UPI0023E23C04|nr:prolyl 4-hydroxylase subunit alpha-3-like [Macrosteles quadrilineatus]
MINFLVKYSFVVTLVIQCNASLRETLDTELKILRYTKDHVDQLSSTVTGIEQSLKQILSSKIYNMDKDDQVNTPHIAMTMLRRLVHDWPNLAIMAGKQTNLHSLQLGEVRWPTISELEQAARNVMRSQLTYTTDSALLLRGSQTDVFVSNITEATYFDIARQYFLKERFVEAKELLQQALTRVQSRDNSPSRETLLYYLAAASCFSGDETNARAILLTITRELPQSRPPQELTDYYNIMGTDGCIYPNEEIYQKLNKRYYSNGIDMSAVSYYRDNAEVENHSRLCRGEVRVDSRLVCRYVHYHQHHLRLQPFKLEELHRDPPVVRFYDLISDSEAEALIQQGKSVMQPASVGIKNARRVSEYRTSHVAWLPAGDAEWLTRRMAQATQMNTTMAHRHQLSRYSISGEYLPHRDHLIYDVDWVDDRLATLMIYLTDVEQGGNTVFTKWQLSVPPVKNSALFWFNFRPNGDPENGSDHSGCPVLRGTKWVLNKWILNYGQDVNFPCTSDKDGSFSGFYL